MSLKKVFRTIGLISFLFGLSALIYGIPIGVGKLDFELIEFNVE